MKSKKGNRSFWVLILAGASLAVGGNAAAPGLSIFQPLSGDNRYNNESISYLWIPPVGFNHSTGAISESRLFSECATPDAKGYTGYPAQCLSSLMVSSRQKYTATINIYDNTGKWLHSHTQTFGECGELENPHRKDSEGASMSWLIWNQIEDSKKTRVGSGVYVWKIHFEYEDGTKSTGVFNQGIARESSGSNPLELCSLY